VHDTANRLAVNPPLHELHKSWPSLEIKGLTSGEICSLTALNGGVAALRDGFHKNYGATLPTQGGAVSFSGGYSFCSAPEQWFVQLDGENAFLDVTLKSVFQSNVAVTLQSDGWARIALIGDRAPQVLERLVAIDLSDEAFPVDSAARSMLGHLNVFVVRLAKARDTYQIWCARSFANSLTVEVCEAAENVCG
jgi:heterotetrameric sarcosine oxidase gamma subunit